MLHEKVTMLILSCEKFSDLWDAHIELLEKNWSDRNIETYIITDCSHEVNYKNVKIICAGEGKEFSERLAVAMEKISTDYIFITLDDYFLIKPVSNQKIINAIQVMDDEKLDYLRLFKRPKKAKGKRIKSYKNINRIINDYRYSVNLYAGIWKKEFLVKTIRDKRDPWRFEISLHKIATELGANCAVSANKEFEILDVVRKGKILNKPYRYFKKHGYYYGNREKLSALSEFKLNIRTWGSRHMPRFIVNMARNFMIKRGHHYYSQDE